MCIRDRYSPTTHRSSPVRRRKANRPTVRTSAASQEFWVTRCRQTSTTTLYRHHPSCHESFVLSSFDRRPHRHRRMSSGRSSCAGPPTARCRRRCLERWLPVECRLVSNPDCPAVMLPTSGLYTDVNETSVLSRCSTVPYGALRCRTVLHFYIGYVAICTAAPYGTAYGTVRRRTVRCRIAPHGAVQCYSFTPDTLLNVLQCTAAPRSTVCGAHTFSHRIRRRIRDI